jgi:transposase
MAKKFYIGIDVGYKTFTASIFDGSDKKMKVLEDVDNNKKGFRNLLRWMKTNGATQENCILCMETTGVYSEKLSYFLYENNFDFAVEHAAKVKRAFNKKTKNDKIDSMQIAKYAYRFFDELKLWKPLAYNLLILKQLQSNRELLVKQKTMQKCALHAIEQKPEESKFSKKIYEDTIEFFEKQIKAIEDEMKNIINSDQKIKENYLIVKSVIGFGLIATVAFINTTNNFRDDLSYKQITSFAGICPYEYQSGISVHKKSRSLRYGPKVLRRVLRLCARSAALNSPVMKEYFIRKLAEKKPKSVIYNNIANKLIKIIVALVRKKMPYIKNYKSVNPTCL